MKTRRQRRNVKSRNNENLAGEHACTDIGQVILFVLLLVTWTTDSFLFHYSDFSARYVPVHIRLPVGIAVLIVSALLAFPAHRAVFGRTSQKTSPITDGVFSVVRHPMYLGSWLSSLGLVIVSFSLATADVCAVIFLFYYLVSRHEEKLLLRKFGAEYQKYKSRVPMLFPLNFGAKRR